MGFLKVILIIVAIYYGLKLALRYLLPWFIKRQFEKMQQFHTGGFNQQQQPEKGKVTVQYNQKNKKNNHSNEGEYVNFEEIK
jgi:hypothetical protein